jgi:hypothetical protein
MNENEKNKSKLIPEQVDSLQLQEQMDTTILKINCPLNIDSLSKINNEWVDYYRKIINDFSLEKFELKSNWTEKELLNGNIFGDFDKEFNINHAKYLVNSPDNKQYIDLDSYQINIEKNTSGDLVLRGGQVDQEINLVNRTTKEIKRIEFFGPTAHIEDIKWIDNNSFVLFGIMNDKLMIEVIQIKELNYYLYEYPVIMKEKGDYNMDIRLKDVKYE